MHAPTSFGNAKDAPQLGNPPLEHGRELPDVQCGFQNQDKPGGHRSQTDWLPRPFRTVCQACKQGGAEEEQNQRKAKEK